MGARTNPSASTPAIGRPRVTDEHSIVEAVLAEGLADFTVTGVAKRLNITHGTLYRYYRSREDLVVAAVNAVVADVEWNTGEMPWREMLDVFARTLWELCGAAPGFANCVLNLPRTPEGILRVIDGFVLRLERQGMKRGEAQVLIDLIGEQVLITSMLLTKADGASVELPEIGETREPVRSAGDELAWADDAGWLRRKLGLIFDGAAYQLTAP